jgi:hypothetical protein
MEREQRALLDAVLRDPDDDTVRLVYADCLDEAPPHPCGCTAWTVGGYAYCSQCGGTGITDKYRLHAELIRLQIELHRTPKHPKWDELRQRQKELNDRAAYWILHEPIIYPVDMCVGRIDGPYPKIQIHRGFVRRWEMPLDRWLAYHEKILSAHPIAEVVINDFRAAVWHQGNSTVWFDGMPPIDSKPFALGRCVMTMCVKAYWPRIKFSCTQRAYEQIYPEIPVVMPLPDADQ